MKKIFAVVALASVFAFALVGCSGGGNKAEEQIRSALDAEFAVFETDDAASLFEGDAEMDQMFTQFGVDATEFSTAYLSKFAYEIQDVTVDGDTAVANVNVTHIDYDAWLASFDTATDEWLAGVSADISEDEGYKQIGAIMLDTIKQAPSATTLVSIEYVKQGSSWQMADPSAVEAELVTLVGGASA